MPDMCLCAFWSGLILETVIAKAAAIPLSLISDPVFDDGFLPAFRAFFYIPL